MRLAIAAVTRALHAAWRYVIKWLMLPSAKYHWAATVDATKAEDWSAVVHHVEAMQTRWKTDESRFALGSAYAKLERFQEALDQLQGIRGTLAGRRAEQERQLNTVVSLWHLGRLQEALSLFPEGELEQDFPDYAESARELRDQLAALVQSTRSRTSPSSDPTD